MVPQRAHLRRAVQSTRALMPELPEVEIVRRGLEPVLVGRRLSRVEARRPDLRFPLPEQFAERLKGWEVLQLGRRAKYLLARLSSGEVLVMHMGMSGRFTIGHHRRDRPGAAGKGAIGTYTYMGPADPKHDHVVLETDDGTTITYNDPRRFGFMLLVPQDEIDAHALFKNLGVEPLGNELSPDYMAAKARGRKTDLKAFLMDQRIVAGLGNIYVCEALFRAGISPTRRAATLTTRNGAPTERADRLVTAIRAVLSDAIAAGGSTLRDYRKADGSLGEFQHSFLVYGREGEPCVRPGCRGIVQRSVQGGRSTFYCRACQN